MRKADMIDIKDILRQRHGPGLTRNDIAAAVGVCTIIAIPAVMASPTPCPPDQPAGRKPLGKGGRA
ncbi:MAG: hypothetical protein OXD36_02550 [Rhodobacter sp.]|nr:hypothetical protein [Rhodobacter sp.]